MELERDTNRGIRVKQVDHDEYSLKFSVENTHTSMVNALRRVILAEVPTFAIKLVNIEINTSCMVDEMIAQRLGLIPIQYDSVDQEMESEPEYMLDVFNEGPDELDVTSDDLVLISGPRILPVGYKVESPIVIAKLKRKEHIKLIATVSKGTGKFHAKWNPTSQCVFRTYANIEVNDEEMKQLTYEQQKAFTDCCPRRVFNLDSTSHKVTVSNPDECIFCKECLVFATNSDINRRNLVKVTPYDDHFLFQLESTGVRETYDIVESGLDILLKKFEYLESELDSK